MHVDYSTPKGLVLRKRALAYCRQFMGEEFFWRMIVDIEKQLDVDNRWETKNEIRSMLKIHHQLDAHLADAIIDFADK